MALYLMSTYNDPNHWKWFNEAWAKTGKKLDMGKACVRFKKLEDLALDVIGQAIKRVPAKAYVENYQAALIAMGKGSPAKAKATEAPAKKAAATKAPASKAPATKTAPVIVPFGGGGGLSGLS